MVKVEVEAQQHQLYFLCASWSSYFYLRSEKSFINIVWLTFLIFLSGIFCLNYWNVLSLTLNLDTEYPINIVEKIHILIFKFEWLEVWKMGKTYLRCNQVRMKTRNNYPMFFDQNTVFIILIVIWISHWKSTY